MERNVILHLHNIIKSFVLIEYKAGNRLLRKAVKRNRLPVNRKRMAITKIYGERDNIQYLYYKYHSDNGLPLVNKIYIHCLLYGSQNGRRIINDHMPNESLNGNYYIEVS